MSLVNWDQISTIKYSISSVRRSKFRILNMCPEFAKNLVSEKSKNLPTVRFISNKAGSIMLTVYLKVLANMKFLDIQKFEIKICLTEKHWQKIIGRWKFFWQFCHVTTFTTTFVAVWFLRFSGLTKIVINRLQIDQAYVIFINILKVVVRLVVQYYNQSKVS